MPKIMVMPRGLSVKEFLGTATSCCPSAYRRVLAQLAFRKWITAFPGPGPIWERIAFVYAEGRLAPLVQPFTGLPPGARRTLWFSLTAIDRALRRSVRTPLGARELARAGLAVAAIDGERVLLSVIDVRAARIINMARVRGQVGPVPVRMLVGAFLKHGNPQKRWIRVSSEMRLRAGIELEAWDLDCPDILSSKKRVRVRSSWRLPDPPAGPHVAALCLPSPRQGPAAAAPLRPTGTGPDDVGYEVF